MKHCDLKLLILLGIVLLLPIHSYSCGCELEAPFLKVAPATELVAVIKVKDYNTFEYLQDEEVPVSMTVEILQVLKGIESRQEITVWGNNGLMCRPYLSIFEPGSTWVMAFGEDPTDGHDGALATDYALSQCGEYFLEVQMGIASGFIDRLQHQQITIGNLAYHLNLIHKEEGKIDDLKCQFINELHFSKIDTIAVFETYHYNAQPHQFDMTADALMVADELYPSFYNFMKAAKVYRQAFIYWQSNGAVFVKQIDNYMDHAVQRVEVSDFFEIYLSYKADIKSEKLKLPKVGQSHKKSKRSKKKRLNIQAQKIHAHLINGNEKGGSFYSQPSYTKHSIQFFMNDHVFLREYDMRLFERFYNRKYYKKNKRTLAYVFLEIMKEETAEIAQRNEKSRNIFKQYKKLFANVKAMP